LPTEYSKPDPAQFTFRKLPESDILRSFLHTRKPRTSKIFPGVRLPCHIMIIMQLVQRPEKHERRGNKMSEKSTPTSSAAGSFLLAIDREKDAPCRGIIQHMFYPAPIHFDSLGEALVQMDRIMDNPRGSLPQAFYPAPIHFDSLGEALVQMDRIMDNPRGSLPQADPRQISRYWSSQIFLNCPQGADIFFIRIRCRQNSSWQGEVRSKYEKKTQYFRSTLELIHLIYSVLPTQSPNSSLSSPGAGFQPSFSAVPPPPGSPHP
jgi:hypothetical protein